jgi:hypothetical protein
MLWVMSMLAMLIAARCRPSAAVSRPPDGASVIAVKFAGKAMISITACNTRARMIGA